MLVDEQSWIPSKYQTANAPSFPIVPNYVSDSGSVELIWWNMAQSFFVPEPAAFILHV